MQETRVRSLGLDDPPEKEMATLSSIFAWEIWQTEETGGLQSTGSHKSWMHLSNYTTAISSSYKPGESFSRAWRSFNEKVIIRIDKAFAS